MAEDTIEPEPHATDHAGDPLAPMGELSISIEMDALRKLNPHDLWSLQQDLSTISDVIRGMLARHRDCLFNSTPVHDVMSKLDDWVWTWRQALDNILSDASPVDSAAIQARACARLEYLTKSAELFELAAIAAEAGWEAKIAFEREMRIERWEAIDED